MPSVSRKSRSYRLVRVTKKSRERALAKVNKVRSRATAMNLRNNQPGFYSTKGRRLLIEPDWERKSYYQVYSNGKVLFHDHKRQKTVVISR